MRTGRQHKLYSYSYSFWGEGQTIKGLVGSKVKYTEPKDRAEDLLGPPPPDRVERRRESGTFSSYVGGFDRDHE